LSAPEQALNVLLRDSNMNADDIEEEKGRKRSKKKIHDLQ
jgi:hypothetical protein